MGVKQDIFSANAGADIGKLVTDFDFSKINVKESSRDDYLHVDIAPSFGTLTQESVKTMDKELKLMIGITMKKLKAIPPAQRDWKTVLATMNQNGAIKPRGAAFNKNDKYKKEENNFLKTDGSPDPAVVKEVSAWFDKLVNDRDVRQSVKFNIDVLGEIVAQTGATIDSLESIIVKNESHEKTIVDIGVLRYPDIENPYFKVYHLKLRAYSNSKRILAWQEDHNGIDGTFYKQEFEPRPEVLAKITDKTMDAAAKEIDDLFS